MVNETAKKRAREIIRNAITEAEKETIKYDHSLQGKPIVTKSDIAAKKKEDKRIDKEMRASRYKPYFLVSLASFFEKFLHIIVTLFTMAGIVNLMFGWQIYKVISAVGWQGIFQTKYTLYILAYFALLFILKKVYYCVYMYANE